MVVRVRILSPDAFSASGVDSGLITYEVGEIYDLHFYDAQAFIDRGWAEEVQVTETYVVEPAANPVAAADHRPADGLDDANVPTAQPAADAVPAADVAADPPANAPAKKDNGAPAKTRKVRQFTANKEDST